ncbi:ATP-dependent DNA helicase RecG [Candidatus Woesebacteria bacterium RBG_16_36_11]|uniref:Probable DNA 3'-5' helicase RecG n=3 Tax=Candidatus Woeseibacteriota TaxID=1752722 RepID=A0A1F7X774_9BACT|nr:MAG: ATP-dependent DNA helicase RecG [Candidatus Woesebacteria bacterium RBG_13_36_22]OGM10942.1 MAG: ATP-dependent DNA helicase RecG [Candidatus Woesebacteria bacterium RBG_16_36_11]OGM16909.1 MAG: ATP-dependent DNA helicase RecG [Candidatus Woesebacteria bacterium RBG_19FT_COMBO_37_29]
MRLSDRIEKLPFVGPYYARKLEKLNISSIEELLLHVPSRYLDYRNKEKIKNVQVGNIYVVRGTLTFIKNQYTRSGKKIQIGKIKDLTGEITLIWFNQPYLVRTIHQGDELQIAGEVGWFGRVKAFVSPEFEKIQESRKVSSTEGLVPIYPETSGLSSKWIRNRIRNAFSILGNDLNEFLPQELLTKEKLPDYQSSVKEIHFPDTYEEAEKARNRLALNELLFFQLTSLYRKSKWQKNRVVYPLKVEIEKIREFINSFPFKLTPSQKRSVEEILSDLKRPIPMNRLLEGDVGSGKTVVAAIAAFVSFLNGKRSVIMAPTQILAEQHFETLTYLFRNYKIRIALVTSGGVKKEAGNVDLFVGTHALLHKNEGFENVALVVIDEQHRFGVEQRSHLIKKMRTGNVAPHVLTMTATPIPRTVALTFYQDLDLSTLDELPKGRISIVTWIVPPIKRDKAYDWIKDKIEQDKIQVFIICPLIEESEKESMKDVKAVKAEYESLRKIFKCFKVGLLHGKLKLFEKNKVIQDFKKGKINILVSTPVVEVGIDIPNANIMLIEAAERFGLAQLHQLRGRVGRGTKKSYCLLFADKQSPKTSLRLRALQKEKSGFKLAEIDLRLRGPGEIFGLRQHGFPELKIATWQDITLIRKTKEIAQEAINNPNKYKTLIKKLKNVPFDAN